jgi:hypothetical protein
MAWCLVCAPAAADTPTTGIESSGEAGDEDEEQGEEEGEEGAAAGGLTLEAMRARWLPALVGSSAATRATLFVCGNASAGEAEAVALATQARLRAWGCAALGRGALPAQPVRRLAPGSRALVEVGSRDAGQKNSACELYWQCGEDNLTTRVRGGRSSLFSSRCPHTYPHTVSAHGVRTTHFIPLIRSQSHALYRSVDFRFCTATVLVSPRLEFSRSFAPPFLAPPQSQLVFPHT